MTDEPQFHSTDPIEMLGRLEPALEGETRRVEAVLDRAHRELAVRDLVTFGFGRIWLTALILFEGYTNVFTQKK